MAVSKNILLLVLYTLQVSPTPHFGDFSPTYNYSVVLDPGHQLNFHWSVDYKNDSVLIKVVARTFNLVGFGVGFSNSGDVTNADFAVFWTSEAGVHHFQDAWTDDRGIVHIDNSQDLVLVDASTTRGMTIVQFIRPIQTCDEHDYQLDNGTTSLVYFLLPKPQNRSMKMKLTGTDVLAVNHGTERVQLLKPDIAQPVIPDDTWTFSILSPRVHVPAQETTYWWYITQLPRMYTKHHIVKYEGVIAGGSESLVHHIEVFHCEAVKGNMPSYNGPGQAENKPAVLKGCRKVIGAWAMGAGPIVYPMEAGSPVGGPGFSRYVLLEVHYNNPDRKEGLIDSSGIRFYVTPQLRRYDAGIMELGLEYTDKMAIPPRQRAYSLSGFCIEECTQLGVPAQGMKIFASQLHTHLTGKKVYTRHLRAGQELPEINRDNHYSPHFQEIRMLPVPAEILPGDALITTCEYSTTTRETVTVGGLAITDEMCVNYIHYYPRSDLEVCKSSVDTQSLQSFFNFMNRMESKATSSAKTARDNYHLVDWTPLNIHLLTYLYDTSPLSMQCNRSDGQRFPGVWDGLPKSKILLPLVSQRSKCV